MNTEFTSFKTNCFSFVLLLILFFGGSIGMQGQTIDNIEITNVSVCQEGVVKVEFDVTKAVLFGNFNRSTVYTLELVNSANTVYNTTTFRSTVTTGFFDIWTGRVTEGEIEIPNNLPNGSFRIRISSKTPDVEGVFSPAFELYSIPTPEITINQSTCIGETIRLFASDIGGATYQWSGPNGFSSTEQNPTITNISAATIGTYTVTASIGACESEPADIDVNPYPNPKPAGENNYGQDKWMGHIYDGIGFNSDLYIGNYQEPEAFDQDFGGSQNCFSLPNGYFIHTETFSARYRMNSTRKGIYAVNLGSDDGSRLSVDGTEVYNSWVDQSFKEARNVLLNLSGNSLLVYDFYENGGDNSVKFSEPQLLMKNELMGNIEQHICSDGPGFEISGDDIGDLPEGISVSGSGYQWFYSSSIDGIGQRINGATGQNFTPDAHSAPFNKPGIYYIYREVSFSLDSNPNSIWRNRSNRATLIVSEPFEVNEIYLINVDELTGTKSFSANNGSTLELTAPKGSLFNEVISATFQNNWCGNNRARNIVKSYIEEPTDSVAIPVNLDVFPVDNLLCEWLGGTFSLSVTASYVPAPDINPEAEGSYIRGSFPEEGNENYIFLWESSVIGPEEGFQPASGVNDQRNYEAGTPSLTTWYRRTINPGGCEVVSNIIKIDGTENLWTGAVSNNWHSKENWSLGTVPNTETNAVIPVVERYPVIQDQNASVYHLSIATGMYVEIDTYALSVAGTISGGGEINAEKGGISFIGVRPQVIPQGLFINNRLQDLHINNKTKVTSEGSLEITGILHLERGSLFTGDSLVLISNQKQTAMIDGSGEGNIVGQVTMQRYLNPAFGYKYFSTPFTNTRVGDFEPFVQLKDSITSFPNFYRYYENRKYNDSTEATGWDPYINPNQPIELMEGYAINFGKEKKVLTISISGKVNNQSRHLSLPNNNGKYTNGFHLLGNPYPSPIDWNKAEGWKKTNIDAAIHFFTADPDDPYSGTYSSYVRGVSSEDGKSSNIIPAMQGFFVHVNEEAPQGSVTINNTARVRDFNQAFVKSSEAREKSLFRIAAAFTGNINNSDPAVLYFDSRAAISFDKELDALKMMNTNGEVPNLYFLTSDGKELSINALPELYSHKLQRIPLGLRLERSGNLELRLRNKDNFPSGYYLYLVDLQKGVSLDIINGGVYTSFLEKGTHNSRFELVLSQNRITNPAVLTKELFSAHTKGKTITIDLNLETAMEAEILVSTISGQIIKTLRVKNQKEVVIEGIKSSGVYIISVKAGETLASKKILMNN